MAESKILVQVIAEIAMRFDLWSIRSFFLFAFPLHLSKQYLRCARKNAVTPPNEIDPKTRKIRYEVGEAIGQEYADCHIYGWYGPAMNMHRTAFNGRNFEYYAEDGVLAGYIASAEVNAAATKGVYAYIKHFVVNDQEINRCTAQQIHLSEQALREIYMKPFEIVVKNFDYDNGPLAVMSSFTLIGPHYTGANSDLLNGVLRDEWGFQGMVLTDWYGSYGYQLTMDSVLNGNDLMLGFAYETRTNIENLDSPTMVKAMRQASKNILFTIVRSGNYTMEQQGGMDNMTKLFVTVDVIIGFVCLAILGAVFGRYFLKKKGRISTFSSNAPPRNIARDGAFLMIMERLTAMAEKTLDLLSGKAAQFTISAANICYVEVFRHHVVVHTEVGTLRIRTSLLAVERQLPSDRFSRCHASYLVNLGKVSEIGTSTVIVSNETLPLSRSFRKRFAERLQQYQWAASVDAKGLFL